MGKVRAQCPCSRAETCLTEFGPVVRTTARTTNLLVILFGAGFSAMLVYALTSELFSKNSATVLYGQACDLIRSSPAVRSAHTFRLQS